MALSLNTNVDSLNAQHNLNSSQASLSTSLAASVLRLAHQQRR